MAKRHTDEDEVLRFQTDRVYKANGDWYFNTRENIQVGPYASETIARFHGSELINQLKKLSNEEEILVAIRNFAFDTTDYSSDFDPSQFMDYVAND